MENRTAVTGEVIYESVHTDLNKKAVKALVQAAVTARAREIPVPAIWVSYLVIFSPGKDAEEVRCQIDVETDSSFAGFSIGYGRTPAYAFNDANERLKWIEKNEPMRISV